MGATYYRTQSFEHRGYFHLPCSDNAVAGILKYSPKDGIKLELIGSFQEDLQGILSDKEEPCIWGQIDNGKDVSLFNCYSATSLNFSCNFAIERYTCSRLLIGAHIDSYKTPLFKNISADIDVMPDWLTPTIVSKMISDNEILTSINTKNLYNNICSVNIDDNKTVFLRESGSYGEDRSNYSITYAHKTFASIEYTEEQSLVQICTDIQKFSDFISFASLKFQMCSCFRIQDNDYTLYVIYKPDRDTFVKTKPYADFLFDYSDIQNIYSSIIKNWYLSKTCHPIISHLLDSVTTKNVFTENDFLNVAQALDGYSKRFIHTSGGGHFDIRLNEMFDKYKDLKIFEEDTFDGKSISHTRNYFSHLFDESTLKGDEIMDGVELFNITKVLRKLLICYIMEHIGFTKENIDRLTQKSTNHYLRKG